ncbi:MAG TPA: hypothetical protein VHT91_19525 [Kofleriaceae bacterium]|jgi:hypothetical protein|nr:hypothetical protein [Kofleriaceae bacterium]
MSTGQIHDLGYKRYAGSRRSVATRWRVIMRHQIAMAWKTWWRFKAWLILAVLATGITIALLYAFSTSVFRIFAGLAGERPQFVAVLLPLSLFWYCNIAFFASLFVAVPAVAGDLQSGAFTFYFARSLRPRDYVIGKLAGIAAMLSLIILAGPLALAIARLGLSDNLDQVIALLPTLPRALAIGALGTLIYTAVPLGFSAVVARRGHAIALWVGYYVVFGAMVNALGRASSPLVASLDLAESLRTVALELYDLHMAGRRDLDIPVSAAVISILGQAAIAIGLVVWRVRRAQQTGVGGAS